MGAKDWMLFYASDDVSKVLRSSPKIDREATTALVERLYQGYDIRPIADGSLYLGNPPEGEVYAGVFPGLSIVCTWEAANDAPTDLSPRFVREAAGRTLGQELAQRAGRLPVLGAGAVVGATEDADPLECAHGLILATRAGRCQDRR